MRTIFSKPLSCDVAIDRDASFEAHCTSERSQPREFRRATVALKLVALSLVIASLPSSLSSSVLHRPTLMPVRLGARHTRPPKRNPAFAKTGLCGHNLQHAAN